MQKCSQLSFQTLKNVAERQKARGIKDLAKKLL